MKADRIDSYLFEVRHKGIDMFVKVRLKETSNEVLRRNGWETDFYDQVDWIEECLDENSKHVALSDNEWTELKDAIDKYLIDDV